MHPAYFFHHETHGTHRVPRESLIEAPTRQTYTYLASAGQIRYSLSDHTLALHAGDLVVGDCDTIVMEMLLVLFFNERFTKHHSLVYQSSFSLLSGFCFTLEIQLVEIRRVFPPEAIFLKSTPAKRPPRYNIYRAIASSSFAWAPDGSSYEEHSLLDYLHSFYRCWKDRKNTAVSQVSAS